MTTESEPQNDAPQGNETVEDFTAESSDPMLAALKDETGEAAPAEGQDGNEGQPAKVEDTPDKQPPAKAADEGKDKTPVMIPKARLDEVLRENAQLKDALVFKDGVIHTQKSMIQSKGSDAPAQGQEGKTTDAPKTDDPTDLIAKAEDDIIALAQKYEDGEISLVEYEKGKLDLNRQIRKLDDDRIAAVTEAAKSTAQQTVNANTLQQQIEAQAAEIQKAHPYIAAIDELPPAIKNGVWETITVEAIENMKEKGITVQYDERGNLKPMSIEHHVAYMNERAALTNKYGPQYTGKKFDGQPTTTQKPLSETAQQRAAKLELASQQPPATSAAGYGADKPSLTETDIENMSQDQLADLEASNPELLKKAAGFTN